MMRTLTLVTLIFLSACSSLARMAMHPSECPAPTPEEAALTQSVWQN